MTPYFPCFRSRLAALGHRTAHKARQSTLQQLQENLAKCLPPEIFSAEDEGVGSRERIYSLRLTLECFLWQEANFAPTAERSNMIREANNNIKGNILVAGLGTLSCSSAKSFSVRMTSAMVGVSRSLS